MLMETVVAEFVPDIQQNQHAARDADRQSNDIHAVVARLPDHVTQRDSEIMNYHHPCLSAFTGFRRDAATACAPIVSHAMTSAIMPEARNHTYRMSDV